MIPQGLGSLTSADGKVHGVGKGGKAPSQDTESQRNIPADATLVKTSHAEAAILG